MITRHLTIIALILLFYSCATEIEEQNFNQEKSNEKGSTLQIKAPLEKSIPSEKKEEIVLTMTSDTSYCYIKEVINQDNFTFLKVDFIKFLMSNQAIEEAKKRGEAAYDIEENGDTNFYVNNDYYIVNDNPKLRLFMLTDSTDIEFHELFGETIADFTNSDKAMERVNLSPFIIITQDGIISHLNEIFVP